MPTMNTRLAKVEAWQKTAEQRNLAQRVTVLEEENLALVSLIKALVRKVFGKKR